VSQLFASYFFLFYKTQQFIFFPQAKLTFFFPHKQILRNQKIFFPQTKIPFSQASSTRSSNTPHPVIT
jgi:hypothetical protein